jgi:acetyl esterase/lipase
MIWLALVLAAGALFLALWIFVPAPTYFLLTFGVGAPEVSPWIALASLVALGLALPTRHSRLGAAVAIAAGIGLLLAVWPIARFPATARAFNAETLAMSVEPRRPARTSRFSVVDFVRGIPLGDAKITRGVSFARPAGETLTLDVYQPTQAGVHPILVQIYGGRWQRGEPGDDANFATLLASHGWVVFAIDYRHAPAFRWEAITADVDSALAWIGAHAAEYGGDTSRVVLMGRSAGGHLATMAAYRTPPLRVRGVVSYYGPADLVDAYKNPPRPDPLDIRAIEEAFIGGTPTERAQEYVNASPVTYATRPQPPTLLVYGRRDHIVEARYGAQLRERLAASGTPVAYLEIPWAEHAFDAVFHGVSSQLALYHVERFLAWAVR